MVDSGINGLCIVELGKHRNHQVVLVVAGDSGHQVDLGDIYALKHLGFAGIPCDDRGIRHHTAHHGRSV